MLQFMEKPEKVQNCVIKDITFSSEVEGSPRYRRVFSAYSDILSTVGPCMKPDINGDALTISASGSRAKTNRDDKGHPCLVPL